MEIFKLNKIIIPCYSSIIFYQPLCKIERKRSKAQKKSFDVVDKNKMNKKHVIIDGMRKKLWRK